MGKYVVIFIIILISALSGTYAGLLVQKKSQNKTSTNEKNAADESDTSVQSEKKAESINGPLLDTPPRDDDNELATSQLVAKVLGECPDDLNEAPSRSKEIQENMKRQDEKYCVLKKHE